MKKTVRLIQKIYADTRLQQVLGIGIIVFFTLSYIILVLNKYWQFEYFAIDNVYFDTALWKLAHFQVPIVHHTILGPINIFGDHFHPTIFLFAMLYWLTSRQEIILTAMCVVYGISAYLGMKIGFKLLKSRFLTYALLVAYFLYIGTQHAMIYGFHEINLMPLFFFLTLYMIVFNHWQWYWLSLALLLLTKESMAVVAICIGIFIFLCYPKKRKEALVTVILSIFYYLVVVKVVIPHIAGGFFYGADIDYPNSIPHFIHLMTDPPEKIETFLVSMATFGFLPILNLFTLPLVAQDFLTRYIIAIPGNIQYTLYFHYNIALAPILFFSSIWSIKVIQDNAYTKKWSKFLPVIGIFILLPTLYFHRLYGKRGPLLLVFNKVFYQTTKSNAFEWELVQKTPKDGTVMTQNHLAYLFSHQGSYIFPSPNDLNDLVTINPKYIVVDLRDGQNPNDYFPLDADQTKKLIHDLINYKIYTVYFQKGSMYILKKSGNAAIPRDIEKMKVKIAMIALNTNGPVGCGDSTQYVLRDVSYDPFTLDQLKLALGELFNVRTQTYGQTGLFNALFPSSISTDRVSIENGDTAVIYLNAKLKLGGVCDTPRFKAQIEQTALQFPSIKKVHIYINNKPIDEALSLK